MRLKIQTHLTFMLKYCNVSYSTGLVPKVPKRKVPVRHPARTLCPCYWKDVWKFTSSLKPSHCTRVSEASRHVTIYIHISGGLEGEKNCLFCALAANQLSLLSVFLLFSNLTFISLIQHFYPVGRKKKTKFECPRSHSGVISQSPLLPSTPSLTPFWQ